MKNKYRFPEDPFAEREHHAYDNPIPSREYLLSHFLNNKKAFTFKGLMKGFKLAGTADEEALDYRLGAMIRAGQLVVDAKNRFVLPKDVETFVGKVSAHRDGYGFVINESDGEDVFLPKPEMAGVMDGDQVRVYSLPKPGSSSKREGIVLEIKERVFKTLIGRLCFAEQVAYLEPELPISTDIIIPPDGLADAHEGQIVSVEIVRYPQKKQQAHGRIVKVLGDYLAPGLEIDIAIHNFHIPHEWPEECLVEAKKIPKVVRKKDIEGRRDLRDKPFITIDGEDAKDFDDAVLCEPQENGFKLYVAIADVGFYVAPGSALDEEALVRGNSVYFPGKVVPMLPESLSNGVCSLKPKVDRLAFVCEIDFDAQANRLDYCFYKAVIHSHARMTYTQVAAILDESNYELIANCAEVLTPIYDLYALYQLLLKQRNARGALEFDTDEVRFVFDKNRKIEKVVPLVRNEAHRLIEECMLAANVAAADFVIQNSLPVLFRIHDTPPETKIELLKEFLQEFGLKLSDQEEPEPKDYAKLLSHIAEKKESELLQTVLLRSLCQAEYSPDNVGHFGLAYDAYTHFTSPIRRYADLLLHRVLAAFIDGNDRGDAVANKLEDIGAQVSMTERRADEATRDVIAWLKCEYMQDKLGEVFRGKISAVTNFGLFVRLDGLAIEGLIHISQLGEDYYHYDQVRHVLVGERGNRQYRLGDMVDVVVARIDLDDRKIDFSLASEAGGDEQQLADLGKKQKQKKRRRSKGSKGNEE